MVCCQIWLHGKKLGLFNLRSVRFLVDFFTGRREVVLQFVLLALLAVVGLVVTRLPRLQVLEVGVVFAVD